MNKLIPSKLSVFQAQSKSKAQREILQKEREDLEDKKKRLIVN